MIKVAIIGKGKFGSKIENTIKDMVQFVNPNDADWVIIATPNDLHAEQVEKWLVKRKNVFCEKPLTLTKRTAEGLFSLADFMGVKLYVDDVLHWVKKLNIDVKGSINFKWQKHGSFNANIIDNLAYHDFYLWVGSDDFEIKDVQVPQYSSINMYAIITLEGGRNAIFEYNILSDDYLHTVHDGWDETIIDYSENNPLKDMLLSVFDNSVNFEHNRKRTLNAIKLCEAVKKEAFPKVLVVGGGIFGTTVATMLATSGYNVILHEELSGIMKCASDINQYRLHKGYHYPRSKDTAQECLDGMKSFKRKYGDSIVNGDINHYYAISSRDSLVSKEEYLDFLDF